MSASFSLFPAQKVWNILITVILFVKLRLRIDILKTVILFILIHSGKKQELFKEREGRGLFSHSHERGWREERERRAGFEGTAWWSSTAPVTQIWASGPKTFRAQAHLSATVLREKSIDLSIIRLGIASCAHRWDYSSLSTCRGLWWQILFSLPSNRKQCRKMEESVVFICLPLFVYV